MTFQVSGGRSSAGSDSLADATLPAGAGGLEVRGHGAGSAVPLGLPFGRGGWHCWHHPSGALAVRRQSGPRPEVLRDRTAPQEKVMTAPLVDSCKNIS